MKEDTWNGYYKKSVERWYDVFFIHHKIGLIMHRTQIYLQDALYEQLKHQSQISNVSISEIIRQAVEKDLNKIADKNARLFFNTLTPLQSFANADALQYVDDLRTTSRILQSEKSNEAADS